MKKIFCSVLLWAPAMAFAVPQIQFKCLSNPPTTSFVVETKNDVVTMTMIQSNGSRYMPIFNGTVTPNDFPFLQSEADFLTQVPDNSKFNWASANCKDNGNSVYECWRGSAITLGKLAIDSFLFYTHRMSEKVFDTQVDWYRVTLSLEKDNRFHDIVMDFSNTDCEFQSKKK